MICHIDFTRVTIEPPSFYATAVVGAAGVTVAGVGVGAAEAAAAVAAVVVVAAAAASPFTSA
jgi:hypothetical protein